MIGLFSFKEPKPPKKGQIIRGQKFYVKGRRFKVLKVTPTKMKLKLLGQNIWTLPLSDLAYFRK